MQFAYLEKPVYTEYKYKVYAINDMGHIEFYIKNASGEISRRECKHSEIISNLFYGESKKYLKQDIGYINGTPISVFNLIDNNKKTSTRTIKVNNDIITIEFYWRNV